MPVGGVREDERPQEECGTRDEAPGKEDEEEDEERAETGMAGWWADEGTGGVVGFRRDGGEGKGGVVGFRRDGGEGRGQAYRL